MNSYLKPFIGVLLALSFSYSAQAQNAALVSVDAVVRQPVLQTQPILGRLVAVQSSVVAAQTGGAVSEVVVKVGDSVKEGQILATLDASTLLLQKQLADSQIALAESRLKTAQAQLSLTAQESKRLGALRKKAAVSQAAYDDAVAAQNIAYSRVQEAQAAINSSTANSRLAELQLSHTNVVAPFAGTVVEKMTEMGNFVQRGQAVVTLISDTNLEVEADVPIVNLGGLTPGSVVEFTLDDDTTHSATVRAIIPRENQRTRSRRVRFTPEFASGTGPLANDQSATILVPISAQRDAITVHKDAIVRKGPKELVYVIVEDTAQIRPIETAIAVGNRLEVISGLDVGEAVVVRGNERLRPNQPVKVQP